jgi:hypothetical protein
VSAVSTFVHWTLDSLVWLDFEEGLNKNILRQAHNLCIAAQVKLFQLVSSCVRLGQVVSSFVMLSKPKFNQQLN